MLTDAAARRLEKVLPNLTAVGFGAGAAALAGFSLWSLLFAPLAGTGGWFVGWVLARWIGRRAAGGGYAPAGLEVYRLKELPVTETSAGGKARSLSRLVRAGEPVPDGLVVLPRAFAGAELRDSARPVLARELARFPAGQRFAVRSSAQTEDSAQASFAGAYESVLSVAAEDVEAAIATVRDSARATRVAAYGSSTGTDPGEVAVVVQAMIPAELSGVIFTVDPLTRDLDTMLGSVVAGLGESLVSGEATGDQFRIHRPSGDFDGPADLAPYAAELHQRAHRIEGFFGGVGQDIEWALADGRIWLLQARPITTLNPWRAETGVRNDSLAGNCLWSATNLSEANPEAQTPLTISLSVYQQANGGPSMVLRGREMAGFIGGRPYANLSVQITSQRGKASKADPREVYSKLSSWWGALPDQVPVPLVPLRAEDWTEAGLSLLGSLLKISRTRTGLPGFLRDHPVRCAALHQQVAACRTPADLRRLWDEELFDYSLRSFWAVIAAASEYPAKLEAELREEIGAADTTALMSNLSGFSDGLESLGPAIGLQQVRAGELSRADYLAKFGHRGVNEGELAWPRPAEDPGWLDRELDRAADGVDLAALRHRQQEAAQATLDKIAGVDRRLARRVERRVRKAARLASLREAARSEGGRTNGVLRSFALRAGELLGIGEDVFLLTIEELLAGLAEGHPSMPWFDERREMLRRYRELPALPGLISGAFDPLAWAADPDRRSDVFVAGAGVHRAEQADSAKVTGYPGAVGRVEGRVRVLEGFDQADQLQPGEVLVTSLTNVGWTPLFPIAKAIVTDLGAPLSHAAIVAREFGIPAVVGCGDATSLLRTGDLVCVDGAAGEVTLLERAGILSSTPAEAGKEK